MNKGIKIGIIAVAVIVVAVLSVSLLFMMKLERETSAMTPLVTGKITDGLFAIQSDYANVYLLNAGDTFIAVDAGTKAKTVAAEMHSLELQPEHVGHVLLTHTDRDHVGGIKAFPNAHVYLSKDEEQMINGNTKRMGIFKNSLHSEYTVLQPNEVITIGNMNIVCIPTPGHTPGSMSYLINDIYLFTGDTLSITNGKAALFNDAFNMDTDTQAESLRTLAQLTGVKYILSAHYGMSSNFESAMQSWD